MQNIRVPPGNMSYITQIGNISALNDLDHDQSVDDLSEVFNHWMSPWGGSSPAGSRQKPHTSQDYHNYLKKTKMER